MTARISGTFSALTKVGDFTGTLLKGTETDTTSETSEEDSEEETLENAKKLRGLRTEFHYNIHVNLPSNGTEETYQNIFNALRKTFQ